MRSLDLQLLIMRVEAFLRKAGIDPWRSGDAQAPGNGERRERLAEPTAFLIAMRPR